MGQRVTCPCYSRLPTGMPPGQEIVTPSLWQDVGADGLPCAFDGHLPSNHTPPVARKLFEASATPPSTNSTKSDPPSDLSQQETSARSSPLISSLFDDSPDKESQTSQIAGEQPTPRSQPKGETSVDRSDAAEVRISISSPRPLGFCWVVSDKYGQRSEWLPKGYQKIQREGLVARVRERLRRSGLNELNKRLEEQRIVRYLLGNNFDADKVAELLLHFCKWCDAYGINEIRRRVIEVPVESFPYFKEVSGVLPFNPVAFETSLGYPVGIYRIGQTNIERFKRLDQVKILNMFRYINERLDVLMFAQTEQSKLIIGSIQIFDFKGLKSYSSVKFLLQNLVMLVVQESSKYYVEGRYHTFLVNVPRIFLPLWYVIRLWLNARMESKVTVSSHVPEALYEMVAKDKLPCFLGGTCHDDYGLGRPR